MKIKYFGHACFLLTSSSGVKILTDPVDQETGYILPEIEADIVTTSHGHHDHCYMDTVKGKFEQIMKSGSYKKHGIDIIAVDTFHDEKKGAQRGSNLVFVYDIDGIRVCHCGDLGHVLTESQLGEIGKVDVLLLPVGGVYTVNYKGAHKIKNLLKPGITIPMHYKTESLTFKLDSVDKFISGTDYRILQNCEIELNREDMVKYPEILVLNYSK